MTGKNFTPNPPELDGCPDMCSLIYLEEGNVMHNLEIRFERKTVYTAVSKILISINPYEWLDIYTDELIKRYELKANGEKMESGLNPHCYDVSATAYEEMKKDNKSQSLIVCGESGSGKTESAKALMSYLVKTKSNRSENQNLGESVMAVNPILEAFGNAKTVMNNNSSRFGKFTKMIFTNYDQEDKEKSCKLIGCVIDSYLLEKSRVVMQSVKERNFHIFFILFKGIGSDPRYGYTDPKDFYYLTQTPEHAEYHKVTAQDDASNFKKLCAALKNININEELMEDMFKTVIAILHIGNINFEEKGQESVVTKNSEEHFTKIIKLLGIDGQYLRNVLLQKKFTIMNEVVISPRSVEEAIDNRNSMAKSLYEKIFQWIIAKCNKELLQIESYRKLRFVGILDVFGFECFVKNSFEQFCINFANERLQQLFSESLMLSEQKEYLKEGIPWTPLKIPDNTKIMELINKTPTGIFAQLEAACNMPKGTPNVFVSNVFKANSSNRKISKVKATKEVLDTLKEGERFNGFKIRHYASTVIYNCNEFLSKNTDRVSPEISDLFSTSNQSILKEIFSKDKNEIKKKQLNRNIGFVFSKELDTLIKTLKITSNFFVRCINPNKNKSSNEFDHTHVKKQLRSGGIVEVLKVIKMGYPTRITYEDLKNYREKIKNHPMLDNLKDKEFWRAILAAFNVKEDMYRFGLTKLFFKPNINFIEKIKNFDGNLTPEMISKIKKMFVKQRLNIIKGLIYGYIRLSSQINKIRLDKFLSLSLVIEFTFGKTVRAIKEKIAQEKEEEERERKRQEQIKRKKEEEERRIQEEKKIAAEEAERKEREIKEKERLLKEEKELALKQQQQSLEEISVREKEMNEKEKDTLNQLEENRKEKLREIQETLTEQKQKDLKELSKKRNEMEEKYSEIEKIKKEEIQKLEESIIQLRSTAQKIIEDSEIAEEERAVKEKEFDESIRRKMALEREEAMNRIIEESRLKSEQIDSELNEYEEKKKAEIQSLLQENEKRLEEKKKEIESFENDSKRRIEEFNKEKTEQFEQMKKLSDESAEKIKAYIEDKLNKIQAMETDLEKRRMKNEAEHRERVEEISIEKERNRMEFEHEKEVLENEMEFKNIELKKERIKVGSLEEMFNKEIENLKKRKKTLKTKESQFKKKKLAYKEKRKSLASEEEEFKFVVDNGVRQLKALGNSFSGNERGFFGSVEMPNLYDDEKRRRNALSNLSDSLAFFSEENISNQNLVKIDEGGNKILKAVGTVRRFEKEVLDLIRNGSDSDNEEEFLRMEEKIGSACADSLNCIKF